MLCKMCLTIKNYSRQRLWISVKRVKKACTYSMLKNVYTHVYTKRELMPDKIHTKPYYDHILKHNTYVVTDFKRDKKRPAIKDRGEMDI